VKKPVNGLPKKRKKKCPECLANSRQKKKGDSGCLGAKKKNALQCQLGGEKGGGVEKGLNRVGLPWRREKHFFEFPAHPSRGGGRPVAETGRET